MQTASGRARFRLVDALALIAIGSLLTLLLAPAFLKARESARRNNCVANLQHIGSALQTYSIRHGVLPPLGTTKDIGVWPKGSNDGSIMRIKSWLMLLLPDITESVKPSSRLDELASLKCPTDDYNGPQNHYVQRLPEGRHSYFARGNYALNAGNTNICGFPGSLAVPCACGHDGRAQSETESGAWWGNGVAGLNKSFRLQDFPRGLATMVAVEEVRAGIRPCDSRGVWALAQIGSSVTYAHGLYGDDGSPNCQYERSDDVDGCQQLHQELGKEEVLRSRMPCCWYCADSEQATARSLHPGGVNLLMLDGSVRFAVDNIDRNCWHVLHSRDEPELKLLQNLEGVLAGDGPTRASTDAIQPEKPVIQKEPAKSRMVRPTITNSIGMELARIAPGQFLMGQADFGETALPEVPPHSVSLTRAYYLGTHEVTQAQYEQLMQANPSWHSSSARDEDGVEPVDRSGFPVEQVSWNEAADFCRRLSAIPAERAAGWTYRLPTEAEWEYACRAGSSGALDSSKPSERILPVGSSRPNNFGLYDMESNVWEWCSDWFARDYYARSPAEDPSGPSIGVLRVVRGTAWAYARNNCQLTRNPLSPGHRCRWIGFRVACDVEDPQSMALSVKAK